MVKCQQCSKSFLEDETEKLYRNLGPCLNEHPLKGLLRYRQSTLKEFGDE